MHRVLLGGVNMNLDRMKRRLVSPRSWSFRTRRAFLLTLPLSVPLWLASVVVLATVLSVRSFWQPLVTFWNAPPTRNRDPYYGYVKRKRPRVISISDREAA